MLGLRFCARAFSSCGERGPLFIAVHGPLTVAASLVVEHRLQTRRLSSCGSRAQLLRGMWDLRRPGLKPVSPALAGRLSTTAPPGKPEISVLIREIPQSSLAPSTMWRYNKKSVSQKGPSPNHAGTLIPDFQPPELRAIHFVVYKLPSLWYFVIAAQMDTCS